MQWLVSITFSREMQRPSSANEWQMPTPPTVLPTIPFLPLRTVPLDEHDTSYFADSASIRNRSIVFSVSMDRILLLDGQRQIIRLVLTSFNAEIGGICHNAGDN